MNICVRNDFGTIYKRKQCCGNSRCRLGQADNDQFGMALPASVAASEVEVAPFNSELIVLSLPKPDPGNSTTLLTLLFMYM